MLAILESGFNYDYCGQRLRLPGEQRHAARAGISLEVFLYPGVGHLYTDPSLPDYDAKAAEATWSRVDTFLAAL